MNKPTKEQQKIISDISKYNLIINAVAGSGKTTTSLLIAKKYEDKNILLLTYNSKLKLESREKARNENIKNIEIHSFHSFNLKYYNKKGFTDKEIDQTIDNNLTNYKEFKYDIIIIDEIQDLTFLYYKLIVKIVKDNNDCKLMVMGDIYQNIYSYNGSDSKFLTFAHKIFNLNKYKWKKRGLRESFRLTNQMANFINENIYNTELIKSNKPGNKPNLFISDIWSDVTYNLFQKLIKVYSPNDIFILAPSVKSINSPVRELENKIKKFNPKVPIYVPVDDDEKIDEKVVKNKLLFSTFHQAKGMERKCVIVFNFDSSYFKFYGTDKNEYYCPNAIYVAITRASENIYLLQNCFNSNFKFLDYSKKNNYTEIKLMEKYCTDDIKKNKSFSKKGVCDLIRHLPKDVIKECFECFDQKVIQNKQNVINIPDKTKQKFGFESLSEINGFFIPFYYQLKKNKEIPEIINFLKEFMDDSDTDFEPKLNDINILDLNIREILYISNLWSCYKSGYLFKKTQIINYDWIKEENLNKLLERFDKLNLSENAIFEKKVEKRITEKNLHIYGFIDCIDEKNVYEFKCVKELKSEHFIQLTIYMLLNEDFQKNYFLINLYDNTIIKLKSDKKRLNKLLNLIINKKPDIEKPKKEFLQNCYNYLNFINQKKIHIFFDIETTGLPPIKNKEFPSPKKINAYDKCRVIELGYIITDENNNKLKENNFLIKHNNVNITNCYIHGITNFDVNKYGISFNEGMKIFENDISNFKGNNLVAHNIDFDFNVLLSELYRYKNHNFIKKFINLNKTCTLRLSRNKRSGKHNLLSVYKDLFNKSFKDQHRALGDTNACKDIYFKLIKM